MTDAVLIANALADPDNPPLTESELERVAAARAVQRARAATGLSQNAFAKRFRINVARLKDWEQGRTMPDSAALAYLKVIENEQTVVKDVLATPKLRPSTASTSDPTEKPEERLSLQSVRARIFYLASDLDNVSAPAAMLLRAVADAIADEGGRHLEERFSAKVDEVVHILESDRKQSGRVSQKH
jgi:putative transcriptional regulator